MKLPAKRFILGALAILLPCSLYTPAASAQNRSTSDLVETARGKGATKEKEAEKPKKDSPDDEEEDITVTVGDDRDEETLDRQGAADAPDFVAPGNTRMELDNNLLKEVGNDAATETSAMTRKNARTMALLIPPLRGQIVDRYGMPLAQNALASQLTLKFGQFEDESEENILSFARQCLAKTRELTGTCKEYKDSELLEHYKHRRWLPLPVTTILADDVVKKLPEELPKGLEVLKVYKRIYPNGTLAAHMLGYVNAENLPAGPINNMDPLWEISIGKSGFEKYFDKALTGRPGVWRLMFDEQGNKVLDELSIKPKPGGTVVTTLNLKWQKLAEQILAKKCKIGAFVVLDVETGEVLVLASRPSFDPNKFIPRISQDEYQAFQKDPMKPLVNRAYRGSYPPASTFKAIVAMAALANGVITPTTTIYCPISITVGGNTFKNWNTKTPEGSINVTRALARSTNPFFYQLGQRMGATPFLSMARKLGMGQRTELPIDDLPGLIPDENWLRRNNRTRFYEGDAVNYSIGQGVVEATPLQVAYAMAGIANGRALPKLSLVKQIQDMDGNVIFASRSEDRWSLAAESNAAAVVRKGLYDVVYGGTGSRSRLSYTTLCGKTGTGQYGPPKQSKYVGWFAGFLPYERPRLAFAAFYEGSPHEKLGGASHAAPIAKEFFETLKDDIKSIIKPVAAVIVDDDDEEGNDVPQIPAQQNLQPVIPVDENFENVPNGEDIPVLPEIQEIDDSSEGGLNALELQLISE